MDNLETAVYFPTVIYSISKPEFLDTVKAVFEDNVAQLRKVPPDVIYPSYMTDNLFMDPRLADFCQYLSSTAWNILDSQGYKMEDKITIIQSLWGQEHYKHSGMDEHVHNDGCQIVAFYVLECPAESSMLTIHDPRPAKRQIGGQEKNIAEVSLASNILNFKLEPGKLYLTNAWLPHSFTRHPSDQPLKFIHCNLVAQFPQPIVV
jgi:hypothetical protein